MKPKKPNSAKRKIAKVNFLSKKKPGKIVAYIAGIGHNLRDYSEVLIRGGHVPDLPGIQYHLIRGKFDFGGVQSVYRSRRRSLYGIKREYLKAKIEKEKRKRKTGFVVNEAYFLTLTLFQILENFKDFNMGFVYDLNNIYTLISTYKYKMLYERSNSSEIFTILKQIKDTQEEFERIFIMLTSKYAELFIMSQITENIKVEALEIEKMKKGSISDVLINKYPIKKKDDFIFIEPIIEKILTNCGVLKNEEFVKKVIVDERLKVQKNIDKTRTNIQTILGNLEMIKAKEEEHKNKENKEQKNEKTG